MQGNPLGFPAIQLGFPSPALKFFLLRVCREGIVYTRSRSESRMKIATGMFIAVIAIGSAFP